MAFYYTPGNCDHVTHILYADNTIVFLNVRVSSIREVLSLSREYCRASG